jgi:hypothetical protein
MDTQQNLNQLKFKDEQLLTSGDPETRAISNISQFSHEFEFSLGNGFTAQQTFVVPFQPPSGSGFITMLQSLDYRFLSGIGGTVVERPLGEFFARVAYVKANNTLVCNVALADRSPINEAVLIRVRGAVLFFN